MESLEQLYKELQPKLYTYFYVKTSNLSVAEDLVQDVFYEASKGIHTFKGQSSLKTWLFSIANHLLKKYYRSKKYEQSLQGKLTSDVSSASYSTEQFIELKQEVQQLMQNIERLQTPAKEIVLLRIYGDLSFKEIGVILEKSENFVRVTFHRAKIKLQRGGDA